MTDIRELLREATEDLAVGHTDPIDQVRRAASRRRRTWAATGAVVVAVIAAIAVPLSLPNHTNSASPVSPRPTPATSSHAVVQDWESDDGEVASGLGAVWGLQCCGGSTARSWVDELNPVTGNRIAHIPLPGPTTQIAVGAGYVWTIGATDGGPSAISAIDPKTLAVYSLASLHNEPAGIAFAGGSAWVTIPQLNEVWRLNPTTSDGMGPNNQTFLRSTLRLGGSPDFIATTGNGTLWVSHKAAGKSSLSQIVVSRHSQHVGITVPWSGDIFSAAGPTTLWASNGARTLMQLEPPNLAGCDACAVADTIIVKGPQIYTAISSPRGMFVSTFGNPRSLGHTDFFSTNDLNESRETPTARIRGGGPLALDGEGVVIGAGQAGLIHWIPPG